MKIGRRQFLGGAATLSAGIVAGAKLPAAPLSPPPPPATRIPDSATRAIVTISEIEPLFPRDGDCWVDRSDPRKPIMKVRVPGPAWLPYYEILS